METRVKIFKIYTDGGARGNPGPGAAGVVIKDDLGKLVAQSAKYLGRVTNNQAEYQGVILGLEKAKELGGQVLKFYLDSELVASQLNRLFKIKEPALQQLFIKAWNLAMPFKQVSYQHIPREKNREADRLVNLELDRQEKKVDKQSLN